MSFRSCSDAAIVGDGLWEQHRPKEEHKCADAVIHRISISSSM